MAVIISRKHSSLKWHNPNGSGAFTLAEVLITLAIIGVVAALTIPTLMNKANDLQNKVAFKKQYSVLSQAFTSLIQENGGSIRGTYNNSNEFFGELKTKFNVTKYCPSPAQGECWHNNNTAKNLNGGADWVTFWGGVPVAGMILSDGSFIAVDYYAKDCDDSESCGIILIDVNGFKKPNIQGKDIFSIYISEDRLLPGGAEHTYLYDLSNHGCSATDTNSNGHAGLGCSNDILTGKDY